MTRTKGPRYYATTKTAAKHVGDLLTLLSEYGAESYHVMQENGKPRWVAFVMGGVPFRMGPNVEGIRARLSNSRSNRADPEAVAWAQLRHLIELQLEAIKSGTVTAAEVFGGYALTSAGRTVAEMIEERGAELLPGEHPLLPSGA